jgi:ElaB/YqjD/DUF883 family membrane-anchored ribosome-binding protein
MNFICQNCGKEYKSKKFYNQHINTCVIIEDNDKINDNEIDNFEENEKNELNNINNEEIEENELDNINNEEIDDKIDDDILNTKQEEKENEPVILYRVMDVEKVYNKLDDVNKERENLKEFIKNLIGETHNKMDKLKTTAHEINEKLEMSVDEIIHTYDEKIATIENLLDIEKDHITTFKKSQEEQNEQTLIHIENKFKNFNISVNNLIDNINMRLSESIEFNGIEIKKINNIIKTDINNALKSYEEQTVKINETLQLQSEFNEEIGNKIDNNNMKLKNELNKLISEVTEHLISSNNNIKTHITNTNEKIESKMTETRNLIDNLMNKLTSVTNLLNTYNDENNQQHENILKQLNNSEMLESVENRINDKLEEQHNNIENRLNEMENNMRKIMENQEDILLKINNINKNNIKYLTLEEKVNGYIKHLNSLHEENDDRKYYIYSIKDDDNKYMIGNGKFKLLKNVLKKYEDIFDTEKITPENYEVLRECICKCEDEINLLSDFYIDKYNSMEDGYNESYFTDIYEKIKKYNVVDMEGLIKKMEEN